MMAKFPEFFPIAGYFICGAIYEILCIPGAQNLE